MLKVSLKLLIPLICSMLAMVATADTLLRDGHPSRYVVQKGDTLWDISGKFLRHPWNWPEIWHINPQVANPHLIYPGDQLELVYINGQPRLQLSRSGDRRVKLSPTVRSTPWSGAIPTIPVDAIAPFLTRPYVLEEKQLDNAPYIVSFGQNHILGGAGIKAYVRSISSDTPKKYDVVRAGSAYKDAETEEILGYEAAFIGTSELLRQGDPATVFLNSTEHEAIIGDQLVVAPADRPMTSFTPEAPSRPVRGSIISVLNGVSQIGQYNVVVLDRGARDGLKPGSVLDIDLRGETIRDVVTPDSSDTVTLPNERAGTLMVFRTFERISFGLVLHAMHAMHVKDIVHNP